jgi:hypothetical protein
MDMRGELLDQLVVELEVEFRLVAEGPYRGLIATGICRGPGGS